MFVCNILGYFFLKKILFLKNVEFSFFCYFDLRDFVKMSKTNVLLSEFVKITGPPYSRLVRSMSCFF